MHVHEPGGASTFYGNAKRAAARSKSVRRACDEIRAHTDLSSGMPQGPRARSTGSESSRCKTQFQLSSSPVSVRSSIVPACGCAQLYCVTPVKDPRQEQSYYTLLNFSSTECNSVTILWQTEAMLYKHQTSLLLF